MNNYTDELLKFVKDTANVERELYNYKMELLDLQETYDRMLLDNTLKVQELAESDTFKKELSNETKRAARVKAIMQGEKITEDLKLLKRKVQKLELDFSIAYRNWKTYLVLTEIYR